MRPEPADRSLLLDMLHHARGVVRSVTGVSLQGYRADEDLRLLIERRIEIIGEAARGVSRSFQSAHPAIPWQKIVAQRHVLAHEYGEVEAELIWRVATVHLPELARQLESLLDE